ncbi:MAG TPA: Calx-beta domain-containing protein, partial [Pirellulales bacterium]|nr:Calx-beta domain-containing protein [Pirellulales bacterium]
MDPGGANYGAPFYLIHVRGTAAIGVDYYLYDPANDETYNSTNVGGDIFVDSPAGASTITLDVVPINDQIAGDPNRTVILSPSSYGDYVLLNPPPPVVTIVNDNLPSVTVEAGDNADVLTGATGSFTFTRADTETDKPLTINYAQTGAAQPGIDYVTLPGSITIPAGATTATLTVTPIDNGPLNSVRFSVVVPGASSGTYALSLGDDSTAPLAYNADAGVVQSALEALPSVGVGNVLVAGSGTSDNPFVIAFKGALAYADLPRFTAAGANLVGAAAISVRVSPPDSAGDPQQVISLSGAAGGSFTLSSGDQTTSTLAWNASAADLLLALEALPALADEIVSVTGAAGGPWTVAFQPGSNVGKLATDSSQLLGGLVVVHSKAVIGNPSVQLSVLSDESYAISSPSSGNIVVAEKFPPPVNIAASQNTASEHAGTPGEFTVTRLGSHTDPLTIKLTVSGDATNYQFVGEGVTFDPSSSTLTIIIPAGQSSATIQVQPIDTGLVGGSTSVTLTVATPDDSSYTAGSQAADSVAVLEDDPPQVNIEATQPLADELAETPAEFTITRNGPTDSDLVVYYTVSSTVDNFNSLPGSIAIPAGQSSITIDVTPFNANLADPDGLVTLSLAAPGDESYVLGPQASDLAVILEDAPPGVSIEATTPDADERSGAAGEFTITRNSGLSTDLTVQYSIGGTAVAGKEYQQLTGFVVIPAGQAS